MILREMLVDALDQVMEIEQDLFHVPWTKEGFFTFLTKENTMFFVIEEKEKILAYYQCGCAQGQTKRRNWRFSDAEPDPPCSREGGYDNPSGSTCGK